MKRIQLCGVCLLVVCLFAGEPRAQAQTLTAVYNFNSATTDPFNFVNPGTLTQGTDGSIYTTSPAGGPGVVTVSGSGTIFSMTTTGQLSELYAFNIGVSPGYQPESGITLGTDGSLYGTTLIGGAAACGLGCGIVFKYGAGLGSLYAFNGTSDGGNPVAAPVEGNDGNYYGTTSIGGGTSNCGTVYKITPTGVLTTLYQFDNVHGCTSNSPLLLGTDGNFYGVTTFGGANADGVVFKITPAGSLSVLFNFDGTHGRFPESGLVQGTDGNFYGTAETGGTLGSGVVFKVTPAGKLSVIHNFPSGPTDGQAPIAGLVQAGDGNFYGVAQTGGLLGMGSIYRVNSTGSSYADLYDFDGTTGSTPYVALLQHTSGTFFGLTSQGGTFNGGTFYSFNVPGLTPFASLLPAAGKVKTSIQILGQGFTGTTNVSFNGTTTTFTVTSDTSISAAVPNAATTGLVTVMTPTGALVSNKAFRVTPTIKSFTPTSGTVGTSVTIAGFSFRQTTKVTFGGVAATAFTVNSDAKVTATVPTGAKSGKIAITTPGGTGMSSASFTVLP